MKINFLNSMKKIYLDHAATTPLHPEVIKIMNRCQRHYFGNASSIHSYGQEARRIIDDSRQMLAFYLNCSPSEIVFTSGGSESDNLAIKGIIEAILSQNHKSQITNHKQISNPKSQKLKAESYKLEANFVPHVVTSAFEHHAVIDTIKELEAEGKIEATYIKPSSDGIVSVKDIELAIKPNTVLVSIMYVNNEIGTVQPIREIGKLIEHRNKEQNAHRIISQKGHRNNNSETMEQWNSSTKLGASNRIFFHTDAVQAAEFYEMSVEYLHVDLLTFTAHKIYGPKGVGALYIKKGTPIKHQIVGGGQEYKLRAGTENVAGIAGFAKAVEIIARQRVIARNRQQAVTKQSIKKIAAPSGLAMTDNTIAKLRDKLINGIEEKISDVRINGSRELRSPNNVNVTFHNAEGESILLNLDAEGIAASSGSACTSGSLEPSHVLMALGRKAEESHGSIRFTLGRGTTSADIDRVLEVLPGIIEKLRKMSPYK